jgi:ribulose-bisphosphate carboxylase large chain
VTPDPDGGQRVTIAIPVAATTLDPAQVLNLIFGNSSLHEDVECVDVIVPASIAKALRGPRFGIEGLRTVAGVHGRPLTCTALKPMGQSAEALADLYRTFARTGIDFVKDDHGLADHDFCRFEDRVRACAAAERKVADEAGRAAVYVPNLIGSPDTIFRQLAFAESCGVRAVMASPMLIGLPVFWELCHRRASVPVLAHPSFAGARRIAHDTLFGKILRLYGADAVIFVNFGSRFRVGEERCRRLARNLVAPWPGVLPALPVPGGGIDVASAARVVAFYGDDVMLLVGGNLQLEAGAIAQRSRDFVAAVQRRS